MARKCRDFLESYLEYSENTESPRSYHLWGGLSVISGALQRKVFIKWGHTEIYPNQYVVLIGPSGARKGEPIEIAKLFLQSVNVTMISEAITRQALMQRMASATRMVPREGTVRPQSPVSIVSGEFAVFLAEGDSKFLADLTDWYDSRGAWTYTTKNMGESEIQGVCVNLFAAMAPDWMPIAIPHTAIGGGFTSRIMFVVENTKGRTIADPNDYPIDPELEDNLKNDLEYIYNIAGEMHFSTAGLKAYKHWYTAEEKKIREGKPVISDPRFSGYVSRRATHVKKIGIAMSASRSDDLTLSEADFLRALALMESIEKNMVDAFGMIGRSQYTEQTQIILEYIKQQGTVKRSKLMQTFYRDVDGQTLDIIDSTLRMMGVVEIQPHGGKEATYTWVTEESEKTDRP